MRKFQPPKGLRKLNKVTYMAIILFLVYAMVWYQDLGYDEYGGTILIIQIFTMIFVIGGLRQMLEIRGSGNFNIPGSGG